MGNQIKTTILITIMTLMMMFIGKMIGGSQGMFIAFIFAAGMNFFSYWFSDKIVLRMYNARQVEAYEFPELYGIVQSLATRANLPMPKIYVIPQEAPNAFATGRNPDNAVVAVTQGLLNIMDKHEIAGVLAHELAHVKNRDILIGSIAATMAGAIMMIANMARWSAMFGGFSRDSEDNGLGVIGVILMSIIAPLAAVIIQMAISRSREYLADSTGAEFAQNPEWLASALEKLDAYSRRIPMEASPATSHMFIVNPLSGKSLMSLFSTHPPMEDRIARLRNKPLDNFSGSNHQSKRTTDSDAKNFWDRLS